MCWAADIAIKVKVPDDMPVKERSQYRRQILRDIYDSQAVIDTNLDTSEPSGKLETHVQESTGCSDDQKNNRVNDWWNRSQGYERPSSRLNELNHGDEGGGDQSTQDDTALNYDVSWP